MRRETRKSNLTSNKTSNKIPKTQDALEKQEVNHQHHHDINLIKRIKKDLAKSSHHQDIVKRTIPDLADQGKRKRLLDLCLSKLGTDPMGCVIYGSFVDGSGGKSDELRLAFHKFGPDGLPSYKLSIGVRFFFPRSLADFGPINEFVKSVHEGMGSRYPNDPILLGKSTTYRRSQFYNTCSCGGPIFKRPSMDEYLLELEVDKLGRW